MKNSDLWKSYADYTNNLSENARKLGFAAAAICWFFKDQQDRFPNLILVALGATVLFFLADILQYLLGALFVRVWTRHHEVKKYKATKSIEGEYDKPAWLDYPSYAMWWIKISSLLGAFSLIGLYIINKHII